MLILRNPNEARRIADPAIRGLVELRFIQVCAGEAYDYDRHGYMVVVEPGDTVQALEQESRCPLLSDPFDGTSSGDPDFTPSFDALEEHDDGLNTSCYEMLFITNDDGFGITFFIPKNPLIDADLLALCAKYATPGIAAP